MAMNRTTVTRFNQAKLIQIPYTFWSIEINFQKKWPEKTEQMHDSTELELSAWCERTMVELFYLFFFFGQNCCLRKKKKFARKPQKEDFIVIAFNHSSFTHSFPFVLRVGGHVERSNTGRPNTGRSNTGRPSAREPSQGLFCIKKFL